MRPDEIAHALIAGERNRTEVPQFSVAHPDLDRATANAAQRAFVQSSLDAREQLVGYKLGLTSRNKQRAMGVDAPLYGRFTTSMMSTLGDPIALDRFHPPRCRVRNRFPAPGRRQGPATVESVLAATEVVYGAVDFHDSRDQGFKFTLTDVIADNASARTFYLASITAGPRTSTCPHRLHRPLRRRGHHDRIRRPPTTRRAG